MDRIVRDSDGRGLLDSQGGAADVDAPASKVEVAVRTFASEVDPFELGILEDNATGGPPMSPGVNDRPARTGMPSVST